MSSPFSSYDCESDGTWSGPPNGFSYFPKGSFPESHAYQFIPLGQSRTVWIATPPDRECTLSVVDPANTFGGIAIDTDAARTVGGLFDVFTLKPMSTTAFALRAAAEATRIFVLSTPGSAERPTFYVDGGGVVTIHYSVSVVLRDCSLSLIYSEGALLNLLSEVEAIYARQANIRLVRVGPIHKLEFRGMSLGPQIITDGPQGEAIRDHITAAGRGHLKNLVYGWDFETKPKPQNASDLSSGLAGGNVAFIDWGNPAMVTVHEFGHLIGLPDRPKGDVTIMQPTRSMRKFIGFDGFQIEMIRRIGRLLP